MLQAEIKIVGRIINNLRYVDDTTLIAGEEKLKSLLRVKEESDRAGSKVNVKKTKIVPSGSITSWQIKGGKCEGSDRFPLIGF